MAGEDSRPTHRVCTKCNEEKPMDQFGNATKGRYGKKSVCKVCEKEYIRQNWDKLGPYYLQKTRERRAKEKAARPAFVGPVMDGYMKMCCRCRTAFDLSMFQKMTSARDGLQKQCKPCRSEIASEYGFRNRDAVNARREAWRAANPEKEKEQRWRDYWSSVVRGGKLLYLRSRISCGIRRSLKSGKESRSAFSLLDYTLEELRVHLERQFLPGMTWSNMSEWHIDHVTPLSSFGPLKAGTPEFKAAWCLSNLRPLWRMDNVRKSNKKVFLI